MYDNRNVTFVFDRSNPDTVTAYVPPNNPNYPEMPEGGNLTLLAELKRGKWCRNDIAMVNICGFSEVIEQRCVYALPNGEVQWNNCKGFFSPDQIKEIEDISKRIHEVSLIYPEMKAMQTIDYSALRSKDLKRK